MKTVADFVLQYPAGKAEETALIFLDSDGCETRTFSYRSLEQSCLTVAGALVHGTGRQTPVLLAVDCQADFVLGFFGSMLAGLIPVPMPEMRNREDGSGFGRIREILKRGQIRSLIVSQDQAGWIEAALSEAGLENLSIWTIESLLEGDPMEAQSLPEIDPDSIAYLQYTSGSTSAPKGVVLKHASVVANLEMMYRVFDRGECARVAGWIPLHHDMGLVGHLFTVLYESGLGVFLPPTAFLAKPSLWLQAIHKYRANVSAAPTFAFEHCVRKIEPDPSWDLSCWKNAYVGSETVSVPILESFIERFGVCGFDRNFFRPVYGLAEATLLVAGGSRGLRDLQPHVHDKVIGGGRRRRLVPYTLENGYEIRIRDTTSAVPVEEGEEGEIWIQGAGLSSGYYEDSAGSEDPGVSDDGFATGDIGFVRDGSLFISGRQKDVVVLRGANYSAEDLEHVARTGVEAMRSSDVTACISDVDDGVERLWVFQEIHRHTSGDELGRIYQSIRSNLVEAFGVGPDQVIFVPAGFIPKTPNHKVARTECRERFLAGELKVMRCFGDDRSATAFAAIDPRVRQVDSDPVVVVGMACRFPGGASDPEQFWKLLADGFDAITEVPADRWNNDLFFDESPAVPGKVNTKWGGFIENISHFDPGLFEIAPYEAPEIDPQQRLLLETSWRLIEHVGWRKDQLAGTSTGVFVGISTNDYLYTKIKLSPGMAGFNAYSGLGNANSIAANRLSYFYDLRGPSVAVDTACSSSLTAFHLGAQAIRSGECEQAIVGGVNAILSPGPTITLSQFGMMSPEGRCKTFDASADGYVRAEGCGLVMLKRRSAARADGDRILAVVDGSAAAQDGASNGITFPNGAAQEQLIGKVLATAGLEGHEISYVEAHGTGTTAGDPVEMEQLRKRYGRDGEAACHIGSVKANIGHLEASAGIASVIKALLMLQKKEIPPQIHLKELNPRIHLDGSRLEISRELVPWEVNGDRRRAAISSFGFGGSLAHVILAEPLAEEPPRQNQQKDYSGAYPFPFVLSAHSPEALQAQVVAFSEWLGTMPPVSFRDLSYGLAKGRTHLRHRAAFLGTSRKGLLSELESWVGRGLVSRATEEETKVCFLFTGQGEHYLHMGKEAYSRFPLFREAFDRCATAIDSPEHPFTLRELAFSIEDTSLWADEYMQPILFAVQYALATLYQDCGIYPNVLLGHSLGEYAAACIAGCLEPEDGMRILFKRGQLIRSLPDVGYMAAVFASQDVVRAEMDSSKVEFAAINSPSKTVISGDVDEIHRLMKHFEERGIQIYFLKTDQAFHSRYMDPILDDFRQSLAAYQFKAPEKKWISALRGEVMSEAPDADYWVDHMRLPVDFGKASSQLRGSGTTDFMEIGPGATSLVAVRENLGMDDALLLRSLNIKKGERTESYFLLDAVGKLYQRGGNIRWDSLLDGDFLPHVLPGQCFMHEPYWIKGITAEDFSAFASPVGRPAKPEAQDPAGWHYTLDWINCGEIPGLPDRESYHHEFKWLIVGRAGPLVDALSAALLARGEQTFWLGQESPGYKPTAKSAALLAQNADRDECFAALSKIISLQSKAGSQDWRMLFVSDSIAPAQWTPAELELVQQEELGLLIPLLQAKKDLAFVFPIWVATTNAQSLPDIDQEPPNLGSAPLWGFCKTLFLEHPEWRGGMIDLCGTESAHARAEDLLKKVVQPQFESCVAIRGNQQFIQQLAPAPLAQTSSHKFRADGAYIITGGLGGLGLRCAQWIASKGGRKLVLLSRRRLPDQASWTQIQPEHPQFPLLQKLLSLEDAGAELEICSMDVRNETALAQLFERLDKEGVPVRGILHAAGVNWFGKIATLEPGEFFDTLKTKISSSWELHRHSLGRDLDCFILFSSVSALWGSAELSHYTAANHFMDMLSIYRSRNSLPSLSIEWGPWAEDGMSAEPAERAVLEKLGFALMRPESALVAMDAALQSGRHLELIADLDWAKFQAFIDFCAQPSLFAQVSTQKEKRVVFEAGNLDSILSSPPEKAREMIEEVVRVELRSVTLIASSDRIDPEQRFNFMGMDSLMAVSFASSLDNYFQIKLPATLIYNYPNIRTVSDHLFELVYVPHARPGLHPESEEEVAAPGLDEDQGTGSLEPRAQRQEDWLRPLRDSAGASQARLFCFPYAGSGISVFGSLVQHFGNDVEIVGVQLPGREERVEVPPFRRMDDLIVDLLKIFPDQDSDYFLFGHSLGGIVAYEFVLALKHAGRKLPLGLIVSGCDAPTGSPESAVHELEPEQFVEEMLDRYEGLQDREERKAALENEPDLLRADLELVETYQPSLQGVQLPLTVICGRGDPLTSARGIKEWATLSDDSFSIFYVDGGHQLLKERPREMAKLIEQQMIRDYPDN